MAHKRKDFTESQKAEIFVRDRATCAFSGISLWVFDHGIRSNYQMDWADHIKPSARGGTASLDNSACASSTFNAKKRHNGSDNVYFFHRGHITRQYIHCFGEPPQALLDDLARRGFLEFGDWFINRAIANTFIALRWRCDVELHGKRAKRDDVYWLNSAWRRVKRFQRNRPDAGIRERGLLPNPNPFGTELLLEMEDIDSKEVFHQWAERLYPYYRASFLAFHRFDSAYGSSEEMEAAVREAAIDPFLHPGVVNSLAALVGMDPEIARNPFHLVPQAISAKQR